VETGVAGEGGERERGAKEGAVTSVIAFSALAITRTRAALQRRDSFAFSSRVAHIPQGLLHSTTGNLPKEPLSLSLSRFCLASPSLRRSR